MYFQVKNTLKIIAITISNELRSFLFFFSFKFKEKKKGQGINPVCILYKGIKDY
jgi:hypothetical protein